VASIISADAEILLVDTSVAIALASEDHEFYDSTAERLGTRTLGLSGHALFETYSSLTRMPHPFRMSPVEAQGYIDSGFPGTSFLDADVTASLLGEMVELRVSGGSVWDALVGACARQHGRTLASRDRKALPTYQALGVDLVLLP
jgi:predicted nucleic acid-binding protein